MSATPGRRPKNSNDESVTVESEFVDESPAPKAVSYSTMEEKLSALEDDNAALRSMLSRQRSPDSMRSPSAGSMSPVHPAARRSNDELLKTKQDLKVQIEKRRGVEALMAREKGNTDAVMLKKDNEISKLQKELQSARKELEAAKKDIEDNEAVMQIQKKENFRLVTLLREHKLDDRPESAPDYYQKAEQAKAEKIKRVVPSSRPFSAVLRSVSPLLKAERERSISPNSRAHTPTRQAMAKNPPVKRPTGTSSSVASNDGSRQAGTTTRFTGRSASGGISNAPGTARSNGVTSSRYSLAPTKREGRGSTIPEKERKKNSGEFKVGSRVVWNNEPAVVRYKGPVVSIGDGKWVGLELAVEGKGEHNGTLNGVRYFSTAPKSAVFVRPPELQPANEPGSRSGSRSPSIGGSRSPSMSK